MKKAEFDHLTLGVCYYPEHWDCALWRSDLQRMKALGIEMIRIAEFAWNFFEPREGEFTFEFFDSFMELATEEDMKVIFCTPTATPPAWMTEKYPEILNADRDGHLLHHGYRRHYNMNSEKYCYFTARIVEKLAEHYGTHPNIIAWQLDNEINCNYAEYYSESDDRAFRAFLQHRFGTVEALNHAIGSAFWNQTYSDWQEVHVPQRTILPHAGSNPHMELLYKRFISGTIYHYFKLQADIIRKYSMAKITTNGLFPNIDYHTLTNEVLDYITYDNYPNFGYPVLGKNKMTEFKDREWSYNLMRTRSISPVFGIMEQQSAIGGTVSDIWQSAPKPGQVRLWTYQAIANGADFVEYFRWRTCTFGSEINWHGLLDYSGRDNRRTAEVKQIHTELQQLCGICGREYVAEVAILKDYDNDWDWDIWHTSADRISYKGWFRALQKKHIPLDLVYVYDHTTVEELTKYKTVIYPHPAILTEKRAALLQAFAEQGGTVLFGCRTGYKNTNGICEMMPMPGYAAPLCGTEVAEYTFVSEHGPEQFAQIGDIRVPAPHFNDILEVTDADLIGIYENDYYRGQCAATVKEVGNGRVYYFGAAFSEAAAAAWAKILELEPPMQLKHLLQIPEQVELAVRGDAIFLLNYTAEEMKISCTEGFTEQISGKVVGDQWTLAPYGVAIFRRT